MDNNSQQSVNPQSNIVNQPVTNQPIAEAQTAIVTEEKANNGKNIIFITLGLIIAILLIAAGVYMYMNIQSNTTTTTQSSQAAQQDIVSVQEDLNTIETLDIDSELQEIDQDLQQL